MEENNIIEIQKEIQEEYEKIDSRWLTLHFRTSFGMVLFSVLVECIIGLIVCQSDFLSTTIPMYILKFLIVPCGINLLLILADFRILHSKKLSQKFKIYSISFVFVLICFVLLTIHIIFVSSYFIFIVPILLTTIYVDYKLTVATSALSITAIICSELFIKWDIDKISIFDSTARLGEFLVAIFITLAFSAVCMVVINFEKKKNDASIQKDIEKHTLVKKLRIDELTGINNRNAFHSELQKMEQDTSDNSYIFAMIDLDNFKEINDRLGHVTGDICLKKFSEILIKNCGDGIPFRFGGDEFCLLFKNKTMVNIVETCQKIQEDCKDLCANENYDIELTASFGLSKYNKALSPSKLIFYTDKALYEAKKVKNTIRIHKY